MSEADRFFAKVSKRGDGCWEWTAARTGVGYGAFKRATKTLIYAHRWSYQYARGPIPDGLVIDHLCRNRACVNPDHLEVVTVSENNRRVPRRSHCGRGHEWNEQNTYADPNGHRDCRACVAVRRELRRRTA